MTSWLKNIFGGGAGPSVRLLGRAGLRYTEGERVMEVDGEMLVGGPADWVVYTDSITRWQPPHDTEPVSAERKAEIVRAICEALRARGVRVETQERPRYAEWPPPGTVVRVDSEPG